ncbi:MAG: hypothetical protein KDE53_26735, partial [Caldilineaceae bacterium]|nr:hypothetical protein [Caldilineaceae bacterium]
GNPSAYGSAAGSPNNAIYVNDNGRIGINTTAPTSGVEIKYNGSSAHNVRIEGNPADSPSSTSHTQLLLVGTGTYAEARLGFSTRKPDGSEHGTAYIKSVASEERGGELLFQTRRPGLGGPLNEYMRITGTGLVGINAADPQARLDIGEGPAWATDPFGNQWGKAISVSNRNAIEFVAGSGNTRFGIGARHGQNGLYFMLATGPSADSTAIYPMMVHSNGNVGIHTTSPSTELHVEGTTTTGVLQITGGADLAEPFAMTDADAIEPGMVVAIDPKNPGQLRLAGSAYDRGVAGIVSGAGGITPGITLQQEGTLAVGDHPVSLSGRVYVWADASYGSIAPTDLLTSSDTLGHAMKVSNYENAHGAIIGKAMTGLEEGTGLVLVLVTLH